MCAALSFLPFFPLPWGNCILIFWEEWTCRNRRRTWEKSCAFSAWVRRVSWQTRARSDCSLWHHSNSKNWFLKPGTILLLGVIQVAANRSGEGAWLVSPDLFIVCCLLLAAEHMVFAWGTDFKNKYVCNPGRVLPAVNMFVVHMVKTGPNDEKGVILCVSQSLSNNLLYF